MQFIPPLILSDGAFFQLSSNRGQHFTGIVGKVQVSHLSRRDGHNGKCLFVLFQWRCANLELKQKCKTEKLTHDIQNILKPFQQGGEVF